MLKQKLTIWGRDFDLDIIFGRVETNQELPYQKKALDLFCLNNDIIQNSLPEVIEYCLNRNKEEIPNSLIDNIFKYVMPKSIYIKKCKSEDHIVGIMCAYKFDPEHGLAVIFKNEKFFKVGQHGDIF